MLHVSAVLHGAFRFAVFPKHYITFNPMQYVVMRTGKEEVKIFSEICEKETETPTITHEQYLSIMELLGKKDNPAILPLQIACYTGCGLAMNML